MIEKIGVIERVKCGIGGYQDCQVVFEFQLKGKGWETIHVMECGWAHVSKEDLQKPNSSYKWTHESRIQQMGEKFWEVIEVMKDAKVSELNKLVGKPVVVKFDSEFGRNLGFTILKEAIL
jgi:hypothetical protein